MTELIDGLEVVVSGKQDDATRPPLVFVHGVGGSVATWDAVLELLPNDRPFIRYSLPGHGRSAPTNSFSVRDFATVHLRLMETLGVRVFDVVGFSLGGLIAEAVALTKPSAVRRLAVIGSVAGRSDEERERAMQRLARLEASGPVAVAQESVPRWYTEKYIRENPGIVERTVQRFASLDRDSYLRAYEALVMTDLIDELEGITQPFLAVAGENDMGSPPRMAKEAAARVDRGEYRVLAGLKHGMMLESPEAVAKLLKVHFWSHELCGDAGSDTFLRTEG